MSWRSKSYEVLPALSVRGADLRASLRVVTVAWMFGVVWMTCVSGPFVKPFARMLGFGDRAFGWLSAAPFIATFGQLIATIIVERTGLRKFQFLHTATIHRALWLVVALIPLALPIPSDVAVIAMLLALCISSFMNALATPAWVTWMGDLIPKRIRGRYMAQRGILSRSVQIVAVIGLGILFDWATVDGAAETAQAQPLLLKVSCIVFAIAAVFGMIDILLFYKIRELKPTVPDKPRAPAIDIRVRPRSDASLYANIAYCWRYCVEAFRQLFVESLKDPAFRQFVLFRATLTFSMTVGGMFFVLTAMEHLGFSKLATSVLFMVIGPLAGIATAKGWGKLNDTFGRRPTLLIASSGIVFTLLPWFFATPTTPHPQFVASLLGWTNQGVSWLIGEPFALVGPGAPIGAFLLVGFACMCGGVCWTGVNLAEISVQFGFSDGKGRSKYVASSSAIISIGGILGGIVGGEVARRLSFLQDSPIGPFQWNNWHATFVLAMLARVLAAVFASRMPDPGSSPTRDVIRHMGVNIYNAISPRLFYRRRIVGLRRNANNNNNHNGDDKQNGK